MRKILFVDIGGTLVDYSNELPRSAVSVLRAARANGHKVYLSTGRSSAEVSPELWNIGVDGLIGANGGYVESNQEVVFHRGLSGEETRKIVDWLYSRNCEFYLESNNGLYASKNFKKVAGPVLEKYSQGKDRIPATVRTQYPDMLWGENLYRDDVNKISYVLNSHEDFEATRDQFPNLESVTWGGFGTDALFGSIGVGDVTKKEAVDRLLKYLNADRASTIAFGDSDQDISLFEASAYRVAMGEASEAIKDLADLVTDDVLDDGLANAFIKLKLVEE